MQKYECTNQRKTLIYPIFGGTSGSERIKLRGLMESQKSLKHINIKLEQAKKKYYNIYDQNLGYKETKKA